MRQICGARAQQAAEEQITKKIDLHIHTVPTFRDSAFTFSIDEFKRYVRDAFLDAVAVTNHDLFDHTQFKAIQDHLPAIVFPGIEICVSNGHVLVVADPADVDEFAAKCRRISLKITKAGDYVTVDDLKTIYGDLSRYLIIPHFDKHPSVVGPELDLLRPYFQAGEVDSAKKFLRFSKDPQKPTPVLFSDARIREDLSTLPIRQTFVDCGEITLAALKICLKDKHKVALSESAGNRLWQALSNGQMLSTGLNVLLGARSSGKTHTLEELNATVANAKYIKQFELVQNDEAAYKAVIERQRSTFVDADLAGFKRVVEDVMHVDLAQNDRDLTSYIETLLKAAEETDRADAYSAAALFSEDQFPLRDSKGLKELIASVIHVIENVEFRPVIESRVQISALKALVIELIEMYRARYLEAEELRFVNELVRDIRESLRIYTAATQVSDVDFYALHIDDERICRFCEIVCGLRQPRVIYEAALQGFKIEAHRGSFGGAGELKTASRGAISFSEAFARYSQPYEYLQELMSNERLVKSELYKLFAKVTYRVLNREGFDVSGGERSEFRLLQEIADAQNFDILLIDEPESSFDNVFLRGDVNQMLKDISETMPVVVVTHNNTVGASIGADYLLLARREKEGAGVTHRLYSGYPGDKQLLSRDGRRLECYVSVMESLEAGVQAYDERRTTYEALKDQ